MPKGDMFLKLEGTRMGPIKGEANDRAHEGEIDILSWRWGMDGAEVHGPGTKSKITVHELDLSKKVDSASTALMICLRSNELIKQAVLTVRKAGGSGQIVEYFKITLEKARITRLTAYSGGDDDPAELREDLRIAFQKILVSYVPQEGTGGSGGGMEFETDVFEGE